MATAKKTTPVVAKKAAVKKTTPAKKVAAPVKPRSDYKAGARVKVTRKTGEVVKGFVTEVKATPTGAFIAVNVGDKKTPMIIQARPAAVRGF